MLAIYSIGLASALALTSVPETAADTLSVDNTTVSANEQSSVAHSAILKQAQDCRAIANDNQRLACFDSIFDRSRGGSQNSSKRQIKVASKTSAVDVKPITSPSSAVQAENADIPTIQQKREESFGSLHIQEQGKSEDELERVTFELRKVSKTARKRQLFYFTNGQVWENKTSQEIRLKTGDLVSVRKGSLGAFYLSKLNGRRSARVKRVK